MKKLIIIGDYGADSLVRQELRSALEGFVASDELPHVYFVHSTPSTIHTAFLLSQVVRTEERYGRSQNTVIFVNTDPRLQSKTGVEKAQGADFVIIRLRSGMYVCGPNAGYSFSLVKKEIEEFYIYTQMNKGSQFRSRDLYMKICALLLNDKQDEMELDEQHTNFIPELEGYFIGHIDNYGNIKTTIPHSKLKEKYEYGELVPITIHGIKRNALFVSNLFGGAPGELVIYPGSSGDPSDPFLEVSVWRHFTEQEKTTGSALFNYPLEGMEVKIK